MITVAEAQAAIAKIVAATEAAGVHRGDRDRR